MPNPVDITGQKYGKLTAIKPTGKRAKSGSIYWLFQCDCGNQKEIPSNSVRSGLIKSCGCIAKPHGETGTRLHTIWCDMKQRCRDKGTKWYGAKGITVCAEWENSYIKFREWALGNGYKDNLTIDRIDNNKGYSPDNCRWATYKQQARNVSTNHFVSMDGETKTVAEWCEVLNITSAALYGYRRRKGTTVEAALYQFKERKAV